MKKILSLILVFVLGSASFAQAVTLAVLLQLSGGISPDPAYKAVSAHYTISDSVALTEIPEASADNIMLPLNAPGTWKSLVIAAIIADAAARGFTITGANIQWLVYEPGDYKQEVKAATWTKDATKTNLPATLTNVYIGASGELQGVNFSGMSQYRLVVFVNKVGTGTQTAALVDNANAANTMTLSDTGAAGEHLLDSGWTNLPAWGTGVVNLKPMASSTVITDDPVYRSFVLYLR